VSQLNNNRRLLLAARVQQDLRTATDLLTRDLRRSGYAGAITAAHWRLSKGAIQMQSGPNWQSLTDIETMVVKTLDVKPVNTVMNFGMLCSPACTASDGSCPAVTIEAFEVRVQSQAAADAAITREIRQTVRVRNDTVTGHCP
jgi:prepilin peptidase dependent protein B